MEKINSLTFQKIAHLVTVVDCQPMFDGGILVNVLGQLKVGPHLPPFRQMHPTLFSSVQLQLIYTKNWDLSERSLKVESACRKRVFLSPCNSSDHGDRQLNFPSFCRQTDEDPPHGFSQVFVLKTEANSWFIQHDVFRLALHHVAA